jgi:NAD(P)-dependent dehydrogenase (short-subunit alcohol dehydrogenase family)
MKIETARHAFITGGASGIGLGVARALAVKGVKVTIADVDGEALEAVIVREGKGFHGIRLDVRDRSGWAAAKAEAEAVSGPVDILFNNAGISSFGYQIADMDPDAFDRVVGVNLTGVFNGISTFAADFRAQGRGHIINTSSMAGICGPSQAIGGSYAAAKFGVVGLSETLRVEMAPHGVGVSILCPGQTATGIAQNSVRLGGDMRMPPEYKAGATKPTPSSKFEHGTVDELVPRVLQGIEDDAAYIISHGRGWWPLVEARHTALKMAFEGML